MLESMALDECCYPNSSTTAASFSIGKPPTTTVPTCDDNLNKRVQTRFDLNHSIQELLSSFIFIFDTTQI
jgi:hypothetical protein